MFYNEGRYIYLYLRKVVKREIEVVGGCVLKCYVGCSVRSELDGVGLI